VVFPVVFETLPTKQFAPVREFRRRVRLALEANNMLPGDPNRVFDTRISRFTAKSDPIAEADPAKTSASQPDSANEPNPSKGT